MRTLVVGGHTRNIGKTALVVDLIRAFPEARWTAVKITQYGHGVCSVIGEECECVSADHSVALDEEHNAGGRSDTSRFLAAGAARAFWMRTQQGHLVEGLPHLREALQGAENVIIESNSLLQFVQPELYLVVLDPAREDFKDSAREFLDRADAFVLRGEVSPEAGRTAAAGWGDRMEGGFPRLPTFRPVFVQLRGEDLPGGLVAFVRKSLWGVTNPVR